MIDKIIEPVLKAGSKMIEPVVQRVSTEAFKHGAKIAAYVGGLAISAIVSSILTSNYKDKAYKSLMTKHDKETAEKLTKQFDEKLNSEKKKWKEQNIKDKETLRQRIRNICNEFGINPNDVIK